LASYYVAVCKVGVHAARFRSNGLLYAL
jgi:hypothetical protein